VKSSPAGAPATIPIDSGTSTLASHALWSQGRVRQIDEPTRKKVFTTFFVADIVQIGSVRKTGAWRSFRKIRSKDIETDS